MKKRIWCLAAAACMAAGSALNAYAAEPAVIDRGWKAVFSGEKMESNFTSEDIVNEIGAMQPGDSVTIRVGVENRDDTGSNWYMKNEVLQSLENNKSQANGGAYTYRLSYQDAQKNETVFFDSDTVGGDGSEEGLVEATDSTKEWFFLDNLEAGKGGTVELTVALDGETIANNYQNTLAELELSFAVEPDMTLNEEDDPDRNDSGGGGSRGGGGSGNGGTDGNRSMVYSPGAVQTNDTNRILLWSVLALACGLGLMAYGILCYKREKGER